MTTLPEIEVGSKWCFADGRDKWWKEKPVLTVVWVKGDEVLTDWGLPTLRRTVDGGIEGLKSAQ